LLLFCDSRTPQEHPHRFQLQLLLHGSPMHPLVQPLDPPPNGTILPILDVIDSLQILQHLQQGIQGNPQPLHPQSCV